MVRLRLRRHRRAARAGAAAHRRPSAAGQARRQAHRVQPGPVRGRAAPQVHARDAERAGDRDRRLQATITWSDACIRPSPPRARAGSRRRRQRASRSTTPASAPRTARLTTTIETSSPATVTFTMPDGSVVTAARATAVEKALMSLDSPLVPGHNTIRFPQNSIGVPGDEADRRELLHAVHRGCHRFMRRMLPAKPRSR